MSQFMHDDTLSPRKLNEPIDSGSFFDSSVEPPADYADTSGGDGILAGQGPQHSLETANLGTDQGLAGTDNTAYGSIYIPV